MIDIKIFEQFRELSNAIEKLEAEFKVEAIKYAEFLSQHDPKNLANISCRDYFLVEPQRYDFLRFDADSDEILFDRYYRGETEYFYLPARWITDQANFKADFLERIIELKKNDDERLARKAQAQEEKDRKEFERLSEKYGIKEAK